MQKKVLLASVLISLLAVVVAGCGTPPAPTSAPIQEAATVTTTVTIASDPCAPGQIEEAVFKVNRHMREFDDAATLASNMPQQQLSEAIADLQRIRRAAEDEQVPACLMKLKQYEVDHMNSVIGALIAFMRSNDPLAIQCVNVESNTESAVICQGIALARQQHDQYLLELARLLGLTVVPATPVPTATETPAP